MRAHGSEFRVQESGFRGWGLGARLLSFRRVNLQWSFKNIALGQQPDIRLRVECLVLMVKGAGLKA